ncbi:MAG: glycosyltransferase [Patescibacteria group bacterium]|nr:glycosyltransferase [Patescibacteria group bacterium]
MKKLSLSIVIPAYNREGVVEEVIDSLFSQSLDKERYEIIVIDDASTDNTYKIFKELESKYPIRLFRNNRNKGPAAARNFGVKQAQGSVILFLDVDIIAVPKLLEKHYDWHQKHPGKEIALVGKTSWHADLEVTPFMRWLERGGPMVDFTGLEHDMETNFLNFYTGNVSLKKAFFLENGGFDETFSAGGSLAYEDTKLGLRLQKAGMRLFYSEEALGYHKDFKMLENVCARRHVYGKAIAKFREKHPEIENYFRDDLKYKLTKPLVNRLTMKLLDPLAKYLETRLYCPPIFWLVCRYYYNQGMTNF